MPPYTMGIMPYEGWFWYPRALVGLVCALNIPLDVGETADDGVTIAKA
jgi:hypothetical protein